MLSSRGMTLCVEPSKALGSAPEAEVPDLWSEP